MVDGITVLHLLCTYGYPIKRESKVMKANLTNTLVGKLKPQDKPYEVRDESLKGLILRVQTTGVKTYYLEYQRGKRIKIGAADALLPAQAREIAKGKLADHYRGEDPIAKMKKEKAETYGQFLDTLYKPHLEATLRKGVNNEENVKETMATLKARFAGFLELSLSAIGPLEIDQWIQSRTKDGVKPASINRQLNDLRACLNKAVEWGVLTASPFDNGKIKAMKTDSNAMVRHLTKEEEERLRTALDEREARMKAARQRANEWRAERDRPEYADLSGTTFADHLKPAVLLSLNTGLRQGELFSLKWADVNFERSILTVVGANAKSGKTRQIDLNPEALEILKQWKIQPGVKCQWVFHGDNGKPFDNVRTSWTGVLKDAEITNFRWHDLRHTFASNLVMAGVDLSTVQELLGHSDYKMTQRYAHLSAKHKQEAVNKLSQRKQA